MHPLLLIKRESILKIGKNLFKLGIFFLPSALFISSILFLLSLIIVFCASKKVILTEKWNYPLQIASIFMVINSIIHEINFEKIKVNVDQIYGTQIFYSWHPIDSWIGLLNWIPLFICFIGFQSFLAKKEDLEACGKIFIAGTIPVLVTGFGQYWFNWYGPMHIFNELIIWFQRPINQSNGLTGLFNNQNYAGCWLNIVWPFSVALLIKKTNGIFKKTFAYAFTLATSLSIILTSSRNAWGGLILTLPFLIGKKVLYPIVIFVLIFVILILLNNYQLLSENVKNIFEIFPSNLNILEEFNNLSYPETNKRLFIYKFALNMILNSPLIGWGASSFSLYYFLSNDMVINHPHNIILEVAFSYGIIPSILIFGTVLSICFYSQRIIFSCKNKINFDNIFLKAWWTSFFVLFCSQMIDTQYFDGRISLTFWILLAGLISIIKNNHIENKNKKTIY